MQFRHLYILFMSKNNPLLDDVMLTKLMFYKPGEAAREDAGTVGEYCTAKGGCKGFASSQDDLLVWFALP